VLKSPRKVVVKKKKKPRKEEHASKKLERQNLDHMVWTGEGKGETCGSGGW